MLDRRLNGEGRMTLKPEKRRQRSSRRRSRTFEIGSPGLSRTTSSGRPRVRRRRTRRPREFTSTGSAWHLLQAPAGQTEGARVYAERRGAGWQSHSVIEVVTDDIPFLVDSVAMALTRRGRDPRVRASDVEGPAGRQGRLLELLL
jgi:NAD-specific glutamate dehydrogenase